MDDNTRQTISTAASDHISANTFRSIDLRPQDAAAMPFAEFVKALLENLERLKKERSAFYENLRRKFTNWANGARTVLTLLGAAAFLLTGMAAAFRFASKTDTFKADPMIASADMYVMIAVLGIYAVMGAIAFYEKGTDKTTAYFRQMTTILAIRDLWTKVQFQLLKELTALKDATDAAAAEPAARERIRALAEAFCADLDKASASELAEFRTEFLASLTELEAASKKGTEDVTKQLQDAAKAAEESAAAAKAEAQKAALAAAALAKLAEDAAKPGFLNLTVVGDFDDEVVISVGDAEAARSRGKIIAIERVATGPRKISARAKKGAKELETSTIVDVKPGLQDVRVTLS